MYKFSLCLDCQGIASLAEKSHSLVRYVRLHGVFAILPLGY